MTLDEILSNKNKYRNMYNWSRNLFFDELFRIIAISIILLKHPMFYEEQEWRLFAALGCGANEFPNDFIEYGKKRVKGKERNVLKLRFGGVLKAAKDARKSFTWNDLLEKILVWVDRDNDGEQKRQRMIKLFEEKGLDFSDKIKFVEIPLRVK